MLNVLAMNMYSHTACALRVYPLSQVWEMYKKAEASFWTAEELDLAHDQKVRNAVPTPLLGCTHCGSI